MKIGDQATRACPKKSWGWEEWIVNNDHYCGKRLHFTKMDGATSLHFHVKKDETMYVESGSFVVDMVNTVLGTVNPFQMEVGHSLHIPPLTPHRIRCISPGVMVEFSTHHEDLDSYRISK